jgi:hypothetical protein
MSNPPEKDPIQKHLDHIVEDEVRRGYAILDVPDHLVAILKADREADPSIPVFTKVRFVKLTAKRRRLIDGLVTEQYFADLQTKTRLSKEQIRKLNIERGQWSEAEETQIRKLQESTAALAQTIFSHGYDEMEWRDELMQLAVKFRDWIERTDETGAFVVPVEVREQLVARFSRWQNFSPLAQETYNQLYPEINGVYSIDVDTQFLMRHVGSVEGMDWLSRMEELRDRLNDLGSLVVERTKLLELQIKQARMYAESVEQRRDATEEYARVYHITEILDDPKHPKPLAPKFEDLWNFPEEVVAWLVQESYLFLNAVPKEARKYLERLGFLAAPQLNGSSDVSDELPVEPNSNLASELLTETDVSSTV